MTSLLLDEDVIAVARPGSSARYHRDDRGDGRLRPEPVDRAVATASVALRRSRHDDRHGARVSGRRLVRALLAEAELGTAASAAWGVLLSWFEVVIAVAAFVCAWAGIALTRTHASRPRWPWEDPFDE